MSNFSGLYTFSTEYPQLRKISNAGLPVITDIFSLVNDFNSSQMAISLVACPNPIGLAKNKIIYSSLVFQIGKISFGIGLFAQ